MKDDIGMKKDDLENLGRLVDRYAQSRSLGLLIPLMIILVNVALIVVAIELISWRQQQWALALLWLVVIWVFISSSWLAIKLVAKYGYRFYSKDGQIELAKEKIPIWAWGLYIVTFLGPAVLSADAILPISWALTMSLASFGIFLLYISWLHKEKALGIVFGGLCLIEAVLTAAGVPAPLANKQWVYSFFVSLMIYLISSGLLTVAIVHIYNRKILHRIQQMRLSNEQQANKNVIPSAAEGSDS